MALVQVQHNELFIFDDNDNDNDNVRSDRIYSLQSNRKKNKVGTIFTTYTTIAHNMIYVVIKQLIA